MPFIITPSKFLQKKSVHLSNDFFVVLIYFFVLVNIVGSNINTAIHNNINQLAVMTKPFMYK